jgi:hypothetical protein
MRLKNERRLVSGTDSQECWLLPALEHTALFRDDERAFGFAVSYRHTGTVEIAEHLRGAGLVGLNYGSRLLAEEAKRHQHSADNRRDVPISCH